jgi:hypothetical protein
MAYYHATGGPDRNPHGVLRILWSPYCKEVSAKKDLHWSPFPASPRVQVLAKADSRTVVALLRGDSRFVHDR